MEGTVQKKLDIKIVILYVLSKLPSEIDINELYDICQEVGIEYFDFMDCLNDLIEVKQIAERNDGLAVTTKGKKNVLEVVSSLPYSLRKKIDRVVIPYVKALARKTMITSEVEKLKNGYCVHMALADGIGEIVDMTLICPDEARAKIMKKNFEDRAEEYYKKITEMLLEKQ